jgi:GNAT superfamily N-acetyltransferase
MESLLEIYQQLKGLGFTLDAFKPEDEHHLYAIFRNVVDTGIQFPYECNSIHEFHRHFFSFQSRVYVCHHSNHEVVGGFYIKSNFSGRSNHIANAAYMVRDLYRNQGVGTLLIKASLHIAKSFGFQAMQFNMVLSQNIAATKLYQKLGFNIIGTIPEGVRKPNGGYQDGFIMYRKFEDF